MKRFVRACVILVLGVLGACAPVRELGGGFRLTRPMGLAPDTPFARAARDPENCQAILKEAGVAFTPVRDTHEGEFCDVRGAILLGPTPVRTNPQRPMMTCPLAASLLLWTRYAVEPAALQYFHTSVSEVDHFGVYSCRRVNGASEGKPSAHARANAIDVAGFRFANGKQVKVLGDWRRASPESQFLHQVRNDACRVFPTVLSADYNALHENHLHLEIEGGGLCS